MAKFSSYLQTFHVVPLRLFSRSVDRERNRETPLKVVQHLIPKCLSYR